MGTNIPRSRASQIRGGTKAKQSPARAGARPVPERIEEALREIDDDQAGRIETARAKFREAPGQQNAEQSDTLDDSQQ